jgi:initiation factor 1A
MVKNVKGGKHKNQARKHLVSNDKKLRLKSDELEIYAQVLNKLGGNKLDVLCMDGKKRLCTIPGKFINKGRRDNLIEKGSWILIGLRDWESQKERENCDLLEVYNDIEKQKLTNTVNENWSLFVSKEKEQDDGIVHFTNEYEEQQEIIHNEIINNVKSISMGDDEIDFDDI